MGFRNFLAWGILKSTKHSGWNSSLLKRFESIWHAQNMFTTTNNPRRLAGVLRLCIPWFCFGTMVMWWVDDGWCYSAALRWLGQGEQGTRFLPWTDIFPNAAFLKSLHCFVVHPPKIGTIFSFKTGWQSATTVETLSRFRYSRKRRQNRSSQDPRNPIIMLFLCIVGYKHNHFTQCSFVVIQNISGTFLPMICQWQWLAFQGILCQWTWLNGNPTKRCTVAPTCLAAFHLTRASHQASHPL